MLDFDQLCYLVFLCDKQKEWKLERGANEDAILEIDIIKTRLKEMIDAIPYRGADC